MRKLSLMVMGVLVLGVSTLVFAASKDEIQPEGSQAAEHIDDQGVLNTNSLDSGDQLKGEARAEERLATEQASKGKKSAKAKVDSKSKAN